MATAVTVTLHVIPGSKTSVRELLDHMDTCFSSRGMMEFMGSAVIPFLRGRAKERFDQEGDGASGKWAPLAQSTVAIREAGIASGEFARISGSHPINVRTHQMEDYITQGRGEVVTEGRSSAMLFYPQRTPPARSGLSAKIRTAQGGKGRTPKRPVLAVDTADLATVTTRLAYFIEGKGYASRG